MTDLLEAARAVAALAREPITTFTQLPTPETAFTQEPRFGALMGPARTATEAERNAVLSVLAPAIVSGDPYQCSRIAILCGTIIEYGADASLIAPALVEALPIQLALAGRIVSEVDEGTPLRALFAQDPDAVKAWEGLSFLLFATMTALCRDVSARIQARATPAIVDALPRFEEHFAPADFLSQLLGYTDDLSLLVLHPQTRKGWRVRLLAVNTNFHLFTLLQARLVGDPSQGKLLGEPTDPNVASTARGQVALTSPTYDHGRFHFHNGLALQADGTVSSDTGGWIWGEETPRNIPVVQGERVVLIGPMIFGSRGWDANFFANIHDALRSDVEILETLSDAQVAEAMAKLRA